MSTLNPIGGTAGLPSGPCNALLSSTPDLDAQLVQCILTNLAPQLQAEFYTLWGLDCTSHFVLRTRFLSPRLPPAFSAQNFTALFVQKYMIQGCIQAGAPPFALTSQSISNPRNMTLDADPALCLSTKSCNWDFNRDDPSCSTGGYRGPNMCAICKYGFCHEVRTNQTRSVPRDPPPPTPLFL